jgi:pimeloyl-ACP methyl ester carboxylesterase
MDAREELEYLKLAVAAAGLTPASVSLPNDRNLIVNDMRIHILEWGPPEGPPIVFLHGGSLTAHTWDLVCAVLSDTYYCVAVDLRGHGDSEWAPDVDYRYETMQIDVEGLISELLLRSPVVVGMSYGGLVAMRMAGDHRVDLGGLVTIDVGPDMHIEAATEIVEFTRQEMEMDSIDDFVEQAMQANNRRRPDLLRRSLLYSLRELPSGRWAWKWDWRRMENHDLAQLAILQAAVWQSVYAITCPTLIVRGQRSRVFLQEDGEKIAAAIPDSSFVVVPNAGHSVQSSNARGLLDVLEPFLEGIFAGWRTESATN